MREEEGLREFRCVWRGGWGGCGGRMVDGERGLGVVYGGKWVKAWEGMVDGAERGSD